MDFPTVSVIIPTYKGADVITDAVQSILDQTYPHFEIIIVDDASPDHTADVVKKIRDPRIKYLIQEKNQGPRFARKAGIHASSGEIIAFLDQDDLYHPEKLQTHVDFLKKHPDVGMSYNARFSIIDSLETIRDIWHPPQQLGFSDAVLGFPLAPSDLVFRREWGIRTEYMEGGWGNSGGEIVLLGRLIFDGCKTGYVDRALNYRRFQSGRIFGNISGNCQSELKCLEIIFSDPRCPGEAINLRTIASIQIYIYWGSRAFIQGQTELGREYYLKAFQLNPAIMQGDPSPLINYLLDFVIEDEGQDHVDLLKRIFAGLSAEMKHLSAESDWAVKCGYVMKAARAIAWGRAEKGQAFIQQAERSGTEINESHFHRLGSILLGYDVEFGAKAARKVLRDWARYFDKLIDQAGIRQLEGTYLLSRAFRSYHSGDYAKVPGKVIRALANNPAYLRAPGVISILVRSLRGMVRQQAGSASYPLAII